MTADPMDPGGMPREDRAPDEPVTLAGFLAARLDETQALAEAAKRNGYPSADFGPVNGWFVDPRQIGKPARPISLMEGKFAAAHDPSRVLREVEAKRRILKRHRNCGSGIGYCDDGGHGSDGTDPGCAEMRDLAAPWSDHPEFAKGWLT
jgi:Family of unknown function (DUF6221)